MADKKPNFEVLEGYADDVLAISAHSKITTEDYENVLIPEFEKKARAEGKVKLLLIFGDDFTGYSVGAAWDDAKFGFLHLKEMAGLAVVSDVEWLRLGVKALAPFIHGPVALFHSDELAEATKWVNEWKHHTRGKPAVEVAAKLPTLEDKA